MTPTAKDDDRGLRCTACGGKRLKVIYTRPKPGGRVVRRRECKTCGQRITTWEKTAGQV
jgi:transcriptional regulator NrdR family protein